MICMLVSASGAGISGQHLMVAAEEVAIEAAGLSMWKCQVNHADHFRSTSTPSALL